MTTHLNIHNVRLGFACNSSSTHSVIFLPDAAAQAAQAVQDNPPNERGSFGWETFTLATVAAKRDYLAAAIFENLQQSTSNEVALTVAQAWSGSDICAVTDEDGYTSYPSIDHQSQPMLPASWEGKGLDYAFIADFRRFLEKDGVVVLGGHDNGESGWHPLKYKGTALSANALPVEEKSSDYVCRKDDAFDYWTLFNRRTGAKLRLSFDTTQHPAPTKASSPELVDVKITDYCPYGCSYCYQGSTTKGRHADKSTLSQIAYQLYDLKVFEVAIGGGEPTLHPKLEDFLSQLQWRQIVANMTTKNLKWLATEAKRLVDAKLLRAIAYSVETAADVEAVAAVVKEAKLGEAVTIQHVVGLDETPEQFRALLIAAAESKLRITLLGFKTTGRGSAFGVRPAAGWLSVLADVCAKQYLRVGIDTVLADRYWDALLKAGVPAWCMTRHEGAFSCYIDAVTKQLGPSSYCDETAMLPLPDCSSGFQRSFAMF